MVYLEIIDKYNKEKIWLIKKYSNSTYYLNQMINKKIFYKKFTQTNKKYIESVLNTKLK